MAPSSGNRPASMCTVDRGGFLLTYDLYGVTLDQPSTYVLVDMTNFQIQVTQVACREGLCVQGVALNYHDRSLVVLMDSESRLQVHVDGAQQGRGADQALNPTGVTGCPLAVSWIRDQALEVGNGGVWVWIELAPLSFKLLISAVGSSLSVVLKDIDPEACCGTRMAGLCGSCGTCSTTFTDTCQLTSASPAPAPPTPSAASCNTALSGSLGQSGVMSAVGCNQVDHSNDLFSALLPSSATIGITKGFYDPYEAPGVGICFDKSSALVKHLQQLTASQVTMEFLVKTCTTSNCHGTLFSYTKDKTFSIRHGSQIQITYGASIWTTSFSLQHQAWNQISLVFDKATNDLDLYYFDSAGLAGRYYLNLTEDVLPNDGYLGVGRWQPSTDSADVLHGPETFKGCIDQLRFWNRTFDNVQIQNHWNVTYNGTEDNLIALWKFDHNRNGYTYDVIHDVEMLVPPVPFPPGQIDYSDAPVPYRDIHRRFPHPATFAFAGRRRKRSLTSELPLNDIISACEYIFVTSDLATSCTGVGSQMTEKYFFDCLSDVYHGEDLSDALPSTLAYADYCEVTLGLSSWPARTLCNYFPYSAGFPNWIGDNCDVPCVSGARHPEDNNTCVCDHGYWAANCSLLCPGGTENACSGYGTCDVLTGACPCPVSRRGAADCGTCEGGWEGADCVLTSSPSSSFSLPVAKVSDLGHMLNLDGAGFGFQGLGEYHLLQLRPNILLQGKFIMCHQNFSCLAFVGMRVGTSGDGYAEITVQAPYLSTSEPTVYVNGALNEVRKVAYFKNFEVRRESLHEVVLDVYNTVQVTIRARKRLLDLTVTVPAANVPASVGLLAGSGSTSWSTKQDYIADHSRVSAALNLCGSGAGSQSVRSSQYYSGTMSLPTSSVLSSPSSGQSLDLADYFARFVVTSCDSVLHYPTSAYSDQQGDGYTLRFDSTAVFSQFDTAVLMAKNLSVEFLVKVDSSGTGGVLLSFATSHYFIIEVDSSWQLHVIYDGTTYTPGLQLEIDVWNKVLFVYESATGEVDMYTFDQTGTVKRAALTLPTAIFDTAGRLALGQTLPPDDGVYYPDSTSFLGELDNFRLWKILIEPTMTLDVSELGMSLSDHTIRAAWTFDEAQDDTAWDLIQGAVLALPVRPWAAPAWTASDKTNTLQVSTSPLVHYFVNKTLETDAESLCSSLVSAVAALPACSSLSAGTLSFYLMQCLQQAAKGADLQAAYLALYDLGDVCLHQLGAGAWPVAAYCTGQDRRGTDCLNASCVFGDWDGASCTCYEGACPAANGQPCNGHGTCGTGGACACEHSWQGSDCTSCASGWTGSECSVHFGTSLTSNPRTGFMSATGEVVTFDGASFTFSGETGVFRLLQDASDGLYVQVHTVHCEVGTCVDAVGVRMFSRKVTVYAPPRDYALPKVKVDGSEVSVTGTEYSVHTYFKVEVLTRNSLKLAISSPYQCDVTVTSAGKFLQTGVYVRTNMCSSSTGLLGRCDGSSSNDLNGYSVSSYSQATLMNQLSSAYTVTFSSSVFSYDGASEFNSVTYNSKAGFSLDLTNSGVQSDRLAYSLGVNQSFTLSFSYRPQNTQGALLTYSRNDSFVIANSNPIAITIGGTTHGTTAVSTLGQWNHIVLGVDRENDEVEFFHSTVDSNTLTTSLSYKKTSLGVHDFMEPGGWLTLGQFQVSIDERPHTLWTGNNMFDGDVSDVILLNGLLPHVVVKQALELHTDILAFAPSDVLYNFRLKEGTSYKVADVTGTTDLQYAYAPWQATTWELSDQTVVELPARNEDQWSMDIDYDERAREATAGTLCSGFFQHNSVTSACSGVDADFRNRLERQCYDSYVATGLPESVLYSMMALADMCDYVGNVDVSATTLCDAQFQNVTWVELRCAAGCKHGYKIADGTCQCYPGYYDTDCSGVCPGGVDTPCSDHGTCNKDGSCTCRINWSGSDCSSCATDWTGDDCNTMVGGYVSGPYTTAVAQIRSQGWVTAFDGNTFFLATDDTYLLLHVHSTGFYVYGRQTLCGEDPKTFTCFDAFMVRHGGDYYFADWTRQDEHALTLKTPSGDVEVLTRRVFGTLTVSRSSLNSFQFQESTAGVLLDVTLYDHGPHVTMQLFRKTDLVDLTLSGLLASCDTQFAARATGCGSGVSMCDNPTPFPSIGHCQTTVSSTSFSVLATNAAASGSDDTMFNTLAGSVPSHAVTEYMLFMNRTGLITADNLTLSTTVPTTFEVIYKPVSHEGVVFAYGDVTCHVALVENDTSLNIVYMNKVVELGQPSVLTEWNQVDLVWDPLDTQLEVFLTDYQNNVYTVRALLDSDAFQSGGRAVLGQMLPEANLSTDGHLNHFVGYMGELRVFTRPHNPVVITQNAFIDVTENTPDLQHAWNFDVNEGDFFIDLKLSTHMVATNVTETPIWSNGDYTLNVKDGATSFWVTLPLSDPFETLAVQKCQGWFSNTTLLSNCQLGASFIDTYEQQCLDDQLARRNHSEGFKSVLQFAEFCRRLEIHASNAVPGGPDTLTHNASDLCREFPEAMFQGYWGVDCQSRCVFGHMEDTGCHCTDPYWGPECDQACPVSDTTTRHSVCDSHGHCRKTDGVCVCQSRWAGVAYNLTLYPSGYIDPSPSYACTVCSDGWYGVDCSTALLERSVNGSDGYALISSSVVITLDGASVELSKTGAYRLLSSTNVTVDGSFRQCQGRHDCRALHEVSVDYNGELVSVSVKSDGKLQVNKLSHTQFGLVYEERDAGMYDNQGNMLVHCSSQTLCRVTVDYAVEVVVEVFNKEMFAGFIVSQNLTSVGVGGLLGNFDGDWLNEFYTGGHSDSYYIANVLTAATKHAEAENYHTVSSGNTVLNNTDLGAAVTATGGHVLTANSPQAAVAFSNIHVAKTDEFTVELWVYIHQDSGHTYSLFTLATDQGDVTLSVHNGQLKLEWQKTYTSYVTVSAQTWSRVAMTWRNSDGLVYLYCLESGGASTVDLEWGFPYGQNITLATLTVLGGSTNAMRVDYVRVWSVVRDMAHLQADLTTYDTAMHYGVEFLALFDEGFGTSSHARVVHNDTVLVVQGTLTEADWAVSDIPTTTLTYPQDLPAIVNRTDAVQACLEEFNKEFSNYCPNFGSIRQLMVELCISDVIRFNDTEMKSMAATAFAFYCQAVTQNEECRYDGYLDFCPGDPSLLPLILGIIFGMLGCCCCLTLLGLLRKKIFGDDEAKPPEKPPKDGGENGPEGGQKGKQDFEEKEFSGGDLPPDAVPPVPPPSTNMYNYLAKMDGVDADDQELFTKYNRSPSVNSIAVSLQSYGIGNDAMSTPRTPLPMSPSSTSLGLISEEPVDLPPVQMPQ
ncbi:uncharacterized protein LOC143287150 [Babylonia areolata]|uniref:uncharacterized protein LOC143287150 n=1 Tax=Babylonia areolata TaxID=304850 RepID=UPI003FD50B8B